MPTLSPTALGTSISRHTENVCRTMLNVTIEPVSVPGPASAADADTVVAFIGLTGAWNGSGAISCSGDVARYLSGRLLMTEFASVDDEVLDAMGELANMVIGNVKEDLCEQLGPLAISTPTVIRGRGLQTRSVDGETDARVSFFCEAGAIEVRISLVKA